MNTAIHKAFKRLKELLAGTDKATQIILRILAAVFGGYALTSSILALWCCCPGKKRMPCYRILVMFCKE
jgi:hypothetical protein